jgi:hypothetical protein
MELAEKPVKFVSNPGLRNGNSAPNLTATFCVFAVTLESALIKE